MVDLNNNQINSIETGKKRERSTPKPWDIQDVNFVFQNYDQMTVADIAEERKLAPFQVNQIISGLRKREVLGKKRAVTHDSILDSFAAATLAATTKKRGRR